jgi:spoIIIJ-associated protein
MDQPPAPPTSRPVTLLDPRQVLQRILDTLQVQTKVEAEVQDGTPLLHIATADPGRLIGRGGQTLHALQFLLNRILQHANPEAPKVIVDCERYRERERDEILKKALEAGEKVKRWGEPVILGPFNPHERRVIEHYIARDMELETVSEAGEDENRARVTIRIKPNPPA